MTTKLKYLLTLLFFTAVCIFLVAANWNNNTPVTAEVDVSMGRGGSPCRSGGGLCAFSLSSGQALNPEDSRGTVYLDEEGNFVLKIPKGNISVAMSEQQFKNHQFSLSEAVTVPTEVLNALQANRSSMTLPLGDYYVEETSGEYKIVFAHSNGSGSEPRG